MRMRTKLRKKVHTNPSISSKIMSIEQSISDSHDKEIFYDESLAVTRIKSDPNFFFRYAKKFSICTKAIGPLLNPDTHLLTKNKTERCSILLDKFNSLFSTPKPSMTISDPVSFFSCQLIPIGDEINYLSDMAPNDTTYKRWSCHSGLKLLCKLCRTSPPQAMGARFTVFWACLPCGPAGWLALLLTKAGDVETNPGPTTLNKKVWICDICHKQIHVRKQISIRCNRIEYWVHLRCAGIRQAKYTDTWTCHLHRESRLTQT